MYAEIRSCDGLYALKKLRIPLKPGPMWYYVNLSWFMDPTLRPRSKRVASLDGVDAGEKVFEQLEDVLETHARKKIERVFDLQRDEEDWEAWLMDASCR